MNRWLEVTLTTQGEHGLLIERALEQLGALAVTLADAGDDPVLEPGPNETPVWPHVRVTGLFPIDFDPWLLKAALEHDYPKSCQDFTHRVIEDQDWARTWMADFRPAQFGQRLWVVPSHCDVPDEAQVVVKLDPGLAFGTGTHPTTGLCLQFLDQLAQCGELAGRTVLDYGCGSGILAIAAIKLGASQALCIDNDPQALQATRENGERNGVGDQLRFPVLEELTAACADVVVANILAGALVQLAPTLTRVSKAEAPLALSGILLDQGQSVRRAYQPAFEQFEIWQEEDWLLIKANKCTTGR